MAESVPASRPPGLWALTRAFAIVGVISMGGGRFAFYFNELVERRRWLTEREMLERFAISQILPGPNIGNFAVLLGQKLRGLPGAVLAMIATLTPGALLMLVLSALYFGRGQVPALTPIFRGIAPAAAGLALATSLQVARRETRAVVPIALAIATILCVVVIHLPTLLVIGVLGGAGIAWRRPRRRS